MVATLLPKHLLRQVVEDWMPNKPGRGYRPPTSILEDDVAAIFQVSKEMARIAADAIHKTIMDEHQQLKAV
jgi:hypothetical protein